MNDGERGQLWGSTVNSTCWPRTRTLPMQYDGRLSNKARRIFIRSSMPYTGQSQGRRAAVASISDVGQSGKNAVLI